MAARPFLELTKLQNRILFEYVRKQGFAEGVQKLYQRLKRDIDDIQHPAMNDKSEVALNDDGEVLEFTEDDMPEVVDNKYTYKSVEFKYETRPVEKKGVVTIKRRKLLPSRRGIEDYFRKDEITQIDRPSRGRTVH